MEQVVTNGYKENNTNVIHLRRMLAHLLELQSSIRLSDYDRSQVKASIKAMKAAIQALECQVFA